MKSKRIPKSAKPAAAASPSGAIGWETWLTPLFGLAALIAAFLAYAPALDGPFLLDDLYLPFGRPDAAILQWHTWTAQRPLLGLTFWANFLTAGAKTFSYHAVNVILHAAAATLVFVIVRRVLRSFYPAEENAGLLAGLAAGVFLLHPVQTEAVAYVASRSDVLSTLFCYAALAVFVGRRTATLTIGGIVLILVLFGAGVLSKEQAAALPAAFFLIDLFAPDGRRNWRLHLPIFGAGALGVCYVLFKLAKADTAGFRVEGLTWYQYFFTEWRVFWRYLQLLVLPFNQNVDPDFRISRTPLEVGAIFGLIGILALVALALWKRREYPLAAAGFLIFIALIAPTSSFVPIRDPIAERRLYFPLIGLLFVVADLVRRASISRATLLRAGGAALLICGGLTYWRAQIWGDEVAFWSDAVAKSPRKYRPHFQLGYAYFQRQQCGPAATEFALASTLEVPEPRLLVDWALALDCANRPNDAIERLREAVRLENTAHINATLGMIYGKNGRAAEALAALDRAQQIDPRYAITYAYRGNVMATQGRWAEAVEQYKTAVKLDPTNPVPAQQLAEAQRRATQR